MPTVILSHDLDSLHPRNLSCDALETPIGIDTASPGLGWMLPAVRRGARQTGYQILVASDQKFLQEGVGDLWDSGRVLSDQSVQTPYQGLPLHSRQRCWWTVRVWDEYGHVSPYSEPTWWEMGLLREADWVGNWIAAPQCCTRDWTPMPAPLLRTTFTINQPIVSARAYVCGLGFHELYLNGRKVSDHVLDPAFTRYDLRALYVAHDITDLLLQGSNALGVILGTGAYNWHTTGDWHFDQAPWRHQPKLRLQLHVTLADGREQVISSDPSWKVATGPLVFDGLRNGETYDARLERTAWTTASYVDDAWVPAMVTPGPGGQLSAQVMPCRVMHTLSPVNFWMVRPGVYVYDFGQNMAGWASLRVSGLAGTEVTLRYAERLSDERDIDTEHDRMYTLSGEFQTDRYILRGEGVEEWEPRFTYHGFQYVQLTGYPGEPTLDTLRGRVVHTDFAAAGDFACSNPMLNDLQRCTQWSYIGNFVGIPTDCPHREKLGWTGDAQIAVETGLFNYAAAPAYRKWLRDIADAQRPNGQLPAIVPTGGFGYNWGSGPAWDSAYLIIAWALYVYCGDKAILTEHYEGLARYVDFMTQMSADHLVNFGLGDWAVPDAPDHIDCPVSVSSTGYYYYNCRLMAQIAALLGHTADAARFSELAEEIRTAFRRAFYDPASGRIATGGQTAQACALYQGVCSPDEASTVVARLLDAVKEKATHLDYGLLGSKYVPNALADHGYAEVAYALFTQTTFPSYGYWLAQGATTLWEDWRGRSSLNHIMFGDISAWCYKVLAGLAPDPERPGFQHVIVHPRPVGDLRWARAMHETPYGTVSSHWKIEGDCFTLTVVLPANTSATITLPISAPDAVLEGDLPAASADGVAFLCAAAGRTSFDIGAGEYHFSLPWVKTSRIAP